MDGDDGESTARNKSMEKRQIGDVSEFSSVQDENSDEAIQDSTARVNMSIEDREIGDVPDFSALEDEDSDEVIKDLTARVNSISVVDREAGLHDLHGIGGIDEKNPAEEQALVHSMRLNISERYSSRAAGAFRVADTTSSEYTQDASFLLMFLRCENYNIDAAVKRLFEFFQQKMRLFGPEAVGKRTMTLNDMSPEEMKCYSAGFIQLLPHRDHIGRAQFIYIPQFFAWKKRENVVRHLTFLSITTNPLRANDRMLLLLT